jgi:hypothetical protein
LRQYAYYIGGKLPITIADNPAQIRLPVATRALHLAWGVGTHRFGRAGSGASPPYELVAVARFGLAMTTEERAKATVSRSGKTFTPKQGQYLAYIHLYTRLHRRPPAETDMQEYFRVSPPSVHQMVLTLERRGFIRRQPRTPRSIEVLVDPEQLPELV